MNQRHVPAGFVEEILQHGTRARKGDEYKITYRGYNIVLVKQTCRLVLVTIFRD